MTDPNYHRLTRIYFTGQGDGAFFDVGTGSSAWLNNQRKDAKVPGRKEYTAFALRSWRLCALALNPGQQKKWTANGRALR